jgi:hypothetical protein
MRHIDGLAGVVLRHLYNTELAIHGISHSKALIISQNSDFERLESLYSCLISVKSWFDIFFTSATTTPLVEWTHAITLTIETLKVAYKTHGYIY